MAAAYAALVSLMSVIHDLQHHPSPPISLRDLLLDPISQHIIFFQDFLQAYSPPPVANDEEELADPLLTRIANAAYAAEDAIETNIVDTIQLSMEPINANDEKSESNNLCRDRLQTVIKEMDSIKNKVVITEEEKKQKMVVVQDQVPMKSHHTSASRNETIVGLDVASREIMEKLTGAESNLQIIPIVGMGGIGKTFIAKSIYDKPLIKEHFDICAWATISQHYNTTEILCEILSQATKQNKKGLGGMSESDLGLKLRKFLFGRRFLIVLDDMWSVDAWDKTRRFYPNNENGSRVLVTTRLLQLCSQLNQDYNHCMSFLDKATSWDLFSKTVFGDNKSCPLLLNKIGRQIVDNCRGLPLSIIVVGGLLKKSDGTQASWKSIRDNLSSMVNMENDKHCLKLLKMSYNHLPIYLKPCFLYMGVFKEDRFILVSMLIKIWVSEGFVKPTNREALKTTARGFLQELIDRNLILNYSLSTTRTGKLKYCIIHDLVRDLCLKEVQKDGLYHVLGMCSHPQEMNAVRRVVIPMNTSMEKVYDDQLRFMPNARSVICHFGDGDVDVDVPQNLRLLRTLHTHDKVHQSFQHQIDVMTRAFHHVNLRHLAICVRGGDMSSFLHSVSLLWNLHTLFIDSCSLDKITLPSDFWKMPQFRNIEVGYHCVLSLPSTPSDDGDGEVIILENLHTLQEVLNFKCCEGMVKRIPNLKKLKLFYEAEGEYFVENIKSLCKLESLEVEEERYTEYSIAGSYLQSLTFPHSLRKLSLFMSGKFELEDKMEKLGSLPLLEKLDVTSGCFEKGKWETVEGQFPCLKYFNFSCVEGLENWTAAEEGSSILPQLEHLIVNDMYKLKEIPLELGNIDTLKKIDLSGFGFEAIKCAKAMVDEQVESQGKLCFHVRLVVDEDNYQSLKSMVGPHIEVTKNFY